MSNKETQCKLDKVSEARLANLLDSTVFEIFTEDGERFVHYYGYGYYNGLEIVPGKPYRFTEYTWFIVPLNEVLSLGIVDYEGEFGCNYKQYIKDCTEEEVLEIYDHYDNGNAPKEIGVITMDTPDGCYVL